ncbi:hypothetical protein BGX34_003596 [Mortierella sp. NVP85]|nr:hypothetical protein BGX34_003596 [Mortierella sp. NVP85]
MSTTSSQAFRAQSSSKVVSIPTRYDDKRKLRVIRWKDIQLCFKDAEYIMYNGDVVLFLTDDDLEDLIPLRVAHHPGVVLEVVVQGAKQGTDDQSDSNSMGFRNDTHLTDEHLLTTGASREVVSVARDVASLRMSDSDNNQVLVVRSQGHSAAIAVQRLPNTSSSHFQQGTGNNVTLQEQLHQLQQQIEGILGKMQQTDQQTQQTQQTQQQMQDQIDKMLQTLQQLDLQHTEQAHQMTQMSELYRQQLEDIQGRAQYQMDEVLHKVQEIDQQARNTLQQCERLQQQIRKAEKAFQQQGHLPFERRYQGTPQVFDQFTRAQCRVQALLANPSHKSPIPRLFILLPAQTTVLGGQDESCSFQYRLHFLCECGAHTSARNSNQPHEVHLANHPGYGLNNQDEFIRKYGPYLLTMMYMIKYGAKTRGLVVPPLLGLKHSIGEDQDIGQLVDNTIEHLKEAAGCTDDDTTAHQNLDVTELGELKSYLKISEGFSGGLNQVQIQKEHYPWICSDHLRECYESTLQQLRHHINTSGGVWHGNEIKVEVTSGATAQQLCDDLIRLLWIQSIEDWRSITEIDLKRGSHHSRSTDVLSGHDDLQSLSLDFGRFKMSIKGIFRGEVKDMTVSIKDLSAPTLDDLEFIQQCRPIALSIPETPPKKDENCLVNMLQRFLSITNLRIDCDMKRFMAVIELIRSTRERMLQSGDKPVLSIFEVVNPEVRVEAFFEEGSPTMYANTCIQFEDRQPFNVDPAMCDFIRQHGYLVTTFAAPRSFNDSLAKLLDESIQEKDSRIVRLDMTPSSLTTPGLNAMTRVINRSQGLAYLRLNLENLNPGQQLMKVLGFLGEHKGQLTSLRLMGWSLNSWLPQIANRFPRDAFPSLEELFVECHGNYLTDIRWITSMISAQPHQRTSLKALGMTIWLSAEDWKTAIKTIDLSALEELHFCTNHFTQVQLKVFVDHIENCGAPSLPLQLLNLSGAALDNSPDTRALIVRLREMIPKTKIAGVED